MSKSQPDISLREAGLEDSEKIYQWRNHPEIRRYCLNQEPIDHEKHIAWYRKVINDKFCRFLIAVVEGKDIGIIRFDFNNDLTDAEISIYVDPQEQGRGYGKAILAESEEWLKANRQETTSLTAKVLADNDRSKALFEKAGFTEQYSVFTKAIG